MSENTTKKKKPNRFRPKTITIRVSESEYEELHKRLEESEFSTFRELVLESAGCFYYNKEDKEELQKMSAALVDCQRQLRGMGINLNQMARVANSKGQLPTAEKLEHMAYMVKKLKKEVEELWAYIKLRLK